MAVLFRKKQHTDSKNTFNDSKVRYGYKDFYKFYRRNLERKECRSVFVQPEKVYSAVLRLFFGKIMRMMIFDGFIFKLPCHMGNWFIAKKKIKCHVTPEGQVVIRGAKVDKVKTSYLQHIDKNAKENNQQVYFLNEHTNGYRFLFKWDIRVCNAKNKSAYGLYPSKMHRRALWKAAIDPDFKVNFVDERTDKKIKDVKNVGLWRKANEKIKEQEININLATCM